MKENEREEKKRPCPTRVRGLSLSLSFLSSLKLLSVVVTHLLQTKRERGMQGSRVKDTPESDSRHSGRRLGRPAL
jgi:hypothetical protein